MASVSAQLQNGFWVGLGFSLAFLLWASLQMFIHRMQKG